MKSLFDEDDNILLIFLNNFNFKKRIRRKYIEYKLGKYSITQEYNSDIINLREYRNISRKEIQSSFDYVRGSRAYRIKYSSSKSKIILKYLKYYLNINNEYRKLKITKLLKL